MRISDLYRGVDFRSGFLGISSFLGLLGSWTRERSDELFEKATSEEMRQLIEKNEEIRNLLVEIAARD